MEITRAWAMPSRHTFTIKPIKQLLDRQIIGPSIDPFAGLSKIATYNNDLDPAKCEFPMDAIEFLETFSYGQAKTIRNYILDKCNHLWYSLFIRR